MDGLRNFLRLPYEQLEEMNLEAQERAQSGSSSQECKDYYLEYLKAERRIKAVTVCFPDLEGRLHLLDYDKNYLIRVEGDVSFDGSQIRGFSVKRESDLLLSVDWASFRWLPSDIFGPGKVMVFGEITHADGLPYYADTRSLLKRELERLRHERNLTAKVSTELEGVLFRGRNAEQRYSTISQSFASEFEFVSSGGYYNALPQDELRRFIDRLAEAQRALGFGNEKDHPELVPSQFELSYAYADPLWAADLIQLYKLVARQAAAIEGFTASFLPKPVQGVKSNGMSTAISLWEGEKNCFFDERGDDRLSKFGWDFCDRLLNSANEICLILNSSVNSYRRLVDDRVPANQIKASPTERGVMIRIPSMNQDTARLEIRSVAPDANPYLAFYALLKGGLEGAATDLSEAELKRPRTRFLPLNINDALRHFKGSQLMKEALSEDVHASYLDLKQQVADRSPRELGSIIKSGEILFHHEVTNQLLWSEF